MDAKDILDLLAWLTPALATGMVMLLRWQRQMNADVAVMRRDLGEVDAFAARLGKLERAHADLRLHLAEHYISREDWVPTASRVLGMLEQHTALLARLDERSRHQEEKRP